MTKTALRNQLWNLCRFGLGSGLVTSVFGIALHKFQLVSHGAVVMLICAATLTAYVTHEALSILPARLALTNHKASWITRLLYGPALLGCVLAVVSFILNTVSGRFLLEAGTLELVGLSAISIYLKAVLGALRTVATHDPAKPPTTAKFILLLVPTRDREHLVGDLEEEYRTIVLPEYGVRMARFWYWWQVLGSVAPLFWSQLKRIAGVVLLWRRVL